MHPVYGGLPPILCLVWNLTQVWAWQPSCPGRRSVWDTKADNLHQTMWHSLQTVKSQTCVCWHSDRYTNFHPSQNKVVIHWRCAEGQLHIISLVSTGCQAAACRANHFALLTTISRTTYRQLQLPYSSCGESHMKIHICIWLYSSSIWLAFKVEHASNVESVFNMHSTYCIYVGCMSNMCVFNTVQC